MGKQDEENWIVRFMCFSLKNNFMVIIHKWIITVNIIIFVKIVIKNLY